jgi:hypothetical protein
MKLRSRPRGPGAVLVALSFALAGCAPRAGQEPERPAPQQSILRVGGERLEMHTEAGMSEHTFGTSATRVWSALPAVFEQLDIPVTLRESGAQMGNQGYPARRVEGKRMSDWIDCGTSLNGVLANAYDITLQVLVTLEPRGQEDTRVTAYVDALGRPRSTSGVPAHCNSKGTLESRILELVGERLVGGGAPHV